MDRDVGIFAGVMLCLIILAYASSFSSKETTQDPIHGSLGSSHPFPADPVPALEPPRQERSSGSSSGVRPPSAITPKTQMERTYGEKLTQSFRIGRGGAGRSRIDEEYIEIRYTGNGFPRGEKSDLNLSDWTVENRRGAKFKLGTIAITPYVSQENQQLQLRVTPGARIIVGTGGSPVGTSLQIDLCSGYFSQFDVFHPSLSRSCPLPKSEAGQEGLRDACLDYIERLPRCTFPQTRPLIDLGPRCIDWVHENSSYAGCVDNHRIEAGLFRNEFRVYLSRGEELWSNSRETIILRDDSGTVVQSLGYR